MSEKLSDHPTGETRCRGLTTWALVRAGLRAFRGRLAEERRLRRAIRELEAFDDHRLRDLGLTREDIECAVSFGRQPTAEGAPASRRQNHAAAAA